MCRLGIFGIFLRGFGRPGSYQLVPRRKRVKGLQGGEPGAGHPGGEPGAGHPVGNPERAPGGARPAPHCCAHPGPPPTPSGEPAASLACLPVPLQVSALRPPRLKPEEGGWEGHGAFPWAVDTGRTPAVHSRTAPLLHLHPSVPTTPTSPGGLPQGPYCSPASPGSLWVPSGDWLARPV